MSKEFKDTYSLKLRFPEFTNRQTWKSCKLSEVLFEHGGKSTGKEDVFSVSVHRGVINQIEHLGRSYSAANTDHYKLVNPGDIIYTKSPTGDFPYGIIKQSKVPKPVIVSPLYGVFKPETIALGTILDAHFEYRENVINYLSSIIQKGAKNTINIRNDVFLSKSLVLPTDPEEQIKIASCISSLDELINAHTQKLDALKAHKKGLMQQLFPVEGKNVPKLRFVEFKEENREWEGIAFGKIGIFTGGGTPSKADESYWDGDIPWISSSDIEEDSITKISISRFITEDALKDSATKKVPPNSILLVSRVGVGKLAISKEAICTSQDFTNFTPDEDDVYFLAYLLKSQKEKLLGFSQGMAIKGFTKDDISKLAILKPSKIEQQKIASCLSSLDELITAQAEKIVQLKQHKKGLMQGLFPNINN